MKCRVKPSYTENAGSVEKSEFTLKEKKQKKKEITVHVYKNKIKGEKKDYCLYSNILYISTMTLDKAGDYIM